MKVLVVKLTSMGDVLHLLPALSELQNNIPSAQVDWMVESSFAEIPLWHETVNRVIPVSTRRWRKLTWSNIKDFFKFIKIVRQQKYDVIVDAQGLMKSGVLARFARINHNGVRAGFSADSIKERPAAWFYSKRVNVERSMHAIFRLRTLFAGVFDYESSESTQASYNVKGGLFPAYDPTSNKIMLFPSTTWNSKHCSNQLWKDIARAAASEHFEVGISWGNDLEHKRALWIADGLDNVEALPKSTLNELATRLSTSAGAISVDTGLGHMAATLGIPAISLYGSTNSQLTGAVGKAQVHLQSDYSCSPCYLKECIKLDLGHNQPPCYNYLTAQTIWQTLRKQISNKA